MPHALLRSPRHLLPELESRTEPNVEETGTFITPSSVPLPPRRPKEAKTQPRLRPVRIVERTGVAPGYERTPADARVLAGKPLDLATARAESEDERGPLLDAPLPSPIPNGRKIKGCLLDLRC